MEGGRGRSGLAVQGLHMECGLLVIERGGILKDITQCLTGRGGESLDTFRSVLSSCEVDNDAVWAV